MLRNKHPLFVFCVFPLADIHYFHCLRIVEILKGTEASSKNIFGRYSSQRMKVRGSHLLARSWELQGHFILFFHFCCCRRTGMRLFPCMKQTTSIWVRVMPKNGMEVTVTMVTLIESMVKAKVYLFFLNWGYGRICSCVSIKLCRGPAEDEEYLHI